jgi:hypothetical protein
VGLLLQAYGMFVHSEETRTFWFNRASMETDAFALVGQLMGLAIYNSVIIEAHFPLVLYAKLLGRQPTFEVVVPTCCLPVICPFFQTCTPGSVANFACARPAHIQRWALCACP